MLPVCISSFVTSMVTPDSSSPAAASAAGISGIVDVPSPSQMRLDSTHGFQFYKFHTPAGEPLGHLSVIAETGSVDRGNFGISRFHSMVTLQQHLKFTNEELQAKDEELQAKDEELQATRAALQASRASLEELLHQKVPIQNRLTFTSSEVGLIEKDEKLEGAANALVREVGKYVNVMLGNAAVHFQFQTVCLDEHVDCDLQAAVNGSRIKVSFEYPKEAYKYDEKKPRNPYAYGWMFNQELGTIYIDRYLLLRFNKICQSSLDEHLKEKQSIYLLLATKVLHEYLHTARRLVPIHLNAAMSKTPEKFGDDAGDFLEKKLLDGISGFSYVGKGGWNGTQPISGLIVCPSSKVEEGRRIAPSFTSWIHDEVSKEEPNIDFKKLFPFECEPGNFKANDRESVKSKSPRPSKMSNVLRAGERVPPFSLTNCVHDKPPSKELSRDGAQVHGIFGGATGQKKLTRRKPQRDSAINSKKQRN